MKRIVKILVLLAVGAFLYDLMVVIGLDEADFEAWVTKMRLRRQESKGRRTNISPITSNPPF